MKTILIACLSILYILVASKSYSECVEYKIVDNGDSVEAVCIGEPPSADEKRKLEKEYDNRQISWEEDKKNRAESLKLEEDRIKLTKVDCSLKDKDCGPGRSCLLTVSPFFGSFGVCKETNAAQRSADRFNQNMSDLRTQQKLDNIDRKLQQLDSINGKLR
jgi:hypothetical protein